MSVIIPTYNRPEFVSRAIESVLAQTYPAIEIIVIDDASEMDVNHLNEEYPSVLFLRNSENRGPCNSRNRGIKEASGDYINFLDDDDELFPKKIELQVRKFQNSNDPDLGMITCHVMDCRSGTKKIIKNNVKGDIYKRLLTQFAVSGTETMLFKKTVFDKVDGFDENLESSQEYDLFIRVSEKFKIDYVDKVLTKKNRSLAQISLNFDKKIKGAKYLFKKHDSRFRSSGFILWVRNRIKLKGLLARYYVGKWFGEKAYRMLGVK